MIELAAFASSEYGKAFARIEDRFGQDPARFIDDEVLAHNLRAAFVFTLAEDSEPEDDGVERAKRGGEQIKAALNG